VTVIDVKTKAVSARLAVGEAPQVVAVAPDGSLVLVTCADGVYAIDTSTGRARRIRARLRHPHGVMITPDGTHAYVTDSERDRVLTVNISSLDTVARIPVGSTPWNTAFSADGANAYVTNANEDTVSVIHTASHRVTTTIHSAPATTSPTTFPRGSRSAPRATSGWPATRPARWS
jgi:phospholipase C